jgi:hypothetical protein
MSKGRVSPQMYKAVSPGSSPKSSLTSSPPLPPPRAPSPPPRSIFALPQSPVGGKMGGDDEGDQEPRAVSQREQPEAGPSDREVHPSSRRCGAASTLHRLRRHGGGKRPRRPARVREGHPQSHSRRRLDIDASKTYGSISLFILMVHLISIR